MDYRWQLAGIIWVAAISLGYIGFSKHFYAVGEVHTFWDIFYRTLQLLALESGFVSGSMGWELQIARFLVPAAAAYTAAQALAVIFREQLQLFRVRLMKNHIVICGLGQKGLLLFEGYRQRQEQVVVIEQNEGNKFLRQCKDRGAIILLGNAADPIILRKARAHKAKCLISVCGDDGDNAEVAIHTRELVWNRKGKALSCLIHISDFQLCNLLKEREIKLGKLDSFRLELFNVYESAARILLDKYPPFCKKEGEYILEPNMVVVGTGRMAESLIVNAARKWWARDKNESGQLHIILFGEEAAKKMEFLYLRYPQLKNACDLLPIEIGKQAPDLKRAKFLFDERGKCNAEIIYVCLDNDLSGLSAGLMVHQQVRAFGTPVITSMTQDKGLAVLLKEDENKAGIFNNLYIFGLFDHTCTPDLISGCTYEILARAIHEDYVIRERAKGHTPGINPSAVPWEELEEVYKKSNIRVAEHIHTKLEAIDCDIAITNDWNMPVFEFSPEELELLAQMEHKRWVEEKLDEGWRYNIAKDPEKKASPYLIPWEELPEVEKDKDREQVRYLPELLSKACYEIYRIKKK